MPLRCDALRAESHLDALVAHLIDAIEALRRLEIADVRDVAWRRIVVIMTPLPVTRERVRVLEAQVELVISRMENGRADQRRLHFKVLKPQIL